MASARLQKEREDIEYSSKNIKKEQTREWDMNDPAYLARDKPIRTDVVDKQGNIIVQNNLGISSGQVFEGEDLANKQRDMLQKY